VGILVDVQNQQVLYGHVTVTLRLSDRRVGDQEVRSLFGGDVETDVVPLQGLVPIVRGAPPIRLPAEKDRERRRPLLPINNPLQRPDTILGNLGFLWLFAVPNEQAADWIVEPEGLRKISYLGGLPNESALEFRNAPLVQNGPVNQFPDLDGFECHFPPSTRVM